MRSAENLLDTTASRIANAPATAPPASRASQSADSEPADSLELTDEMTSLLGALTSFEVNGKALEAEASMAENTLNIVA